jgi:hypothetical protein
LFQETDQERDQQAARETGISTRGVNIEGVMTAVNLIDKSNSDSDDNIRNALNLMDPDSSDNEDNGNDDKVGVHTDGN